VARKGLLVSSGICARVASCFASSRDEVATTLGVGGPVLDGRRSKGKLGSEKSGLGLEQKLPQNCCGVVRLQTIPLGRENEETPGVKSCG
jgi:hypothetical protein